MNAQPEHACPTVGAGNCPTQFVVFPKHSQESADGHQPSQEHVCDSGSVTAALDRSPSGLDNVTARTGRTARTNPVGVPMSVLNPIPVSFPPSGGLTSFQAFLDASGLPVAMPSNRRVYDPLRDRELWDADMGRIAHRLIGLLAPACQLLTADESQALVSETLTQTKLPGRGDRSRIRLTGLISAYTRLHLPQPPATFIGAEYPLSTGRADLVWHREDIGTFVDEIKTWRRANWTDAAEQIDRYMRGGVEAFTNFAGVRFIYRWETLAHQCGSRRTAN